MAVGIGTLDEDAMRRTAERLSSQRLMQRSGATRPQPTASARPQVVRGQPSAQAQAWQAQRATGAGTTNTAAPRPAAPATTPAATTPAAPRASGGVRGALRTAGRAALPVGAGIGAFEAGMTPTEQMREDIGMDPSGTSVGGDLLARTAGTMRRVGDVLSAGFAQPVGEWIGGKLADRADRARGVDQMFRAPSVAQPAAQVATADTSQAATAAAPGTIYRHGNQFSDQPIEGGVQFNPREARGGFAGSTNPNPQEAQARTQQLIRFVNQREAEQRDQLARRNAAIDANINWARQREAEERGNADFDRTRRELERGARGGHGVSARDQRESRMALAQLQRPGVAPIATSTRTPEQEQALAAQRQAQQVEGQQADQEGIAAGIQNAQLLRAQEIQQQLDQIGGADPAARRALIDRALVSQGKDPDAGRFITIDSLSPDGMTTLKSALDTRSGQIVGGAGVVGTQGGQAPSLDEFLKRAKADPRNRGQSDEQLTAYYQQKYGT